MINEEHVHELASDRPIESPSQDRFERSTFARQLASGIARRKGRDSFVVALQGAWGSGKTSVKNLVLQELKNDLEQGKPSPHVVEFEPWQLRDADSLFAAFFKEISIAVGEDANDDDHKKERLLRYSKTLALGGTAAKWIGVVVGAAGIPGAAAAGQAISEKAKDFGEVLQQGTEATADEPQQSLKQLKDELKKAMGELDRPILVVIDDIDRLEVEEMLLIFQLVKANADFPNFTYLLLLPREAVQKALVDRLGEHGRSYLDKIIQLSLDVPPANAGQRRTLFTQGVKDLMESWGLTLSVEVQTDLELLWHSCLGAMLQHPRDVILLLNALEFTLGVMKGEAGLEVNLADFVALESLRLAETAVYACLPRLKALLTEARPPKTDERNRYSHVIETPETEDEEQPGQAEVDEVLQNLSPIHDQATRKLLGFVFPKSSWALKIRRAHDLEMAPQRGSSSLRASESRYFERYFALAIPEDQISEAELNRFLSIVGDAATVKSQLEHFDARDLLDRLLLEIYDRFSLIPAAHRIIFLATLLDFCEVKGGTNNSTQAITYLIFNQLVYIVRSPEERGEMFQQIYERSRAFGIPAYWTYKDAKKDSPIDGYIDTTQWMTSEKRSEVHTLLSRRIAERAEQPNFFQAPFANHAIYFWSQTEPEAVKTWVNRQLSTDVQLRDFLVDFRDVAYSTDNTPSIRNVDFSPEVFDWLNDVADIQSRVQGLDTIAWSEVDKFTADQFVHKAQLWLNQKAASVEV